jgi:hypothetical protein
VIKCNVKFENLEEVLVDLQPVLKNSLQKEILTIKELNKEGEKFKKISEKKCDLKNAVYVIFSSYMCKDYHESESFIFVDATGKSVCTISGRETDLYDMIKDCHKLVESKSY